MIGWKRSMSYISRSAAMLVISLAASVASAQNVPGSAASQATQRDLTEIYHTRSPWQLVVTEGPMEKDYGDNDAPGKLTFCLYRRAGSPCISAPVTPPLRDPATNDAPAWAPHYLQSVRPVYPQGSGGRPLLMIVTGSLNAGNGDQVVATQLLKYDAAHDAFQRVFAQRVGRNNNQDIRFVERGPLMGSVITVEPQQKRPYGYWIVMLRPSAAGVYQPVMRYGSSTLYNDGNPLPVIDSKMPNILARLGMWKAGQPLPMPQPIDGKVVCPKPVLKRRELWCQ